MMRIDDGKDWRLKDWAPGSKSLNSSILPSQFLQGQLDGSHGGLFFESLHARAHASEFATHGFLQSRESGKRAAREHDVVGRFFEIQSSDHAARRQDELLRGRREDLACDGIPAARRLL